MSALFSFPNTVNEVSARVVAGGVVTMCLLTIALRQPLLTAIIAYGFLARLVSGPSLSPLGQFATRVVTPRLPVTGRIVPGAPKRFAQGIGAALSSAAALTALVGGRPGIAYVLLGALASAAFLEAAFGLCLGCQIFSGLMRAHLIPESVCAECADIWARPRAA